jgi:hypothetical protein
VVELKKFEMTAPEDRAAVMAAGGGNIHEIPPGALTMPSPPAHLSAPATAQPSRAPAPARGAQGTPSPANGSQSPMGNGGGAEQAIQEGLKSSIAQHILNEWALALQSGRDPALFVNTFMEWMKDETPAGAEGRKGCAAFAQLMDVRDWPAMKKLIAPSIPTESRKFFDLASADEFYNAFRVMVCESVRDYWRVYLVEKQRMMQERAAAHAAAQQPAAPVEAPEPAVEPAEEPAAEAAPATEEAVGEEAEAEPVGEDAPK